jgi:hypothetical protein
LVNQDRRDLSERDTLSRLADVPLDALLINGVVEIPDVSSRSWMDSSSSTGENAVG